MQKIYYQLYIFGAIYNKDSNNESSACLTGFQHWPAITVLTHSYSRDMAEVLWEKTTGENKNIKIKTGELITCDLLVTKNNGCKIVIFS